MGAGGTETALCRGFFPSFAIIRGDRSPDRFLDTRLRLAIDVFESHFSSSISRRVIARKGRPLHGISAPSVVSETIEAAAALMHLVITFNATQQCSLTLERAEMRSASPL
jgi:hypothetical protein